MRSRIILLMLLLLTLTTVRAQESHVQLRYEKSIDRTVVTSDLLYVVNMPSQFMQIQLVGRYPGKGKPSQMPDRIYIQFYSFAPDALYRLDSKHRLLVKVDSKVIDFGLLSYSNVDGKGKDPKERKNLDPLKSNVGFSINLPPAAVIATAHKKDDLTVELMTIEKLSLAELRSLAGASELAMKVGDTVFAFRPVHMAVLREFTESISPANFNSMSVSEPEREKMPPDVPSDEKQTPLAETLGWLKTHLERNGATNDIVMPRRFEPLNFNSCQIAYQVTPVFRNSPVSSSLVNAIMEYQVHLGDLNPEALRVSDLEDHAMVSMTVRDYQPKIKVFKHANDNGMMGRTLEEALTEKAVVILKNKAAALQFKNALSHAINLCRAQR
jgi:hypothetical protein